MVTEAELTAEAEGFLLKAGYDRENLVKEYAYSWRADPDRLARGQAALVAFSGKPHSLHTSCVAVVAGQTGKELEDELNRLRYLAAPVALALSEGKAELWGFRKELPPAPFQEAPRATWQDAFQPRLSELSPVKIGAAKRGDIQHPFVDLGFTEWAESITGHTLTGLLESLIADSLKLLPAARRGSPAAETAILRLACHLFACRVLEDKGIIRASQTPEEALSVASEQFPDNIDPTVLDSPYVSERAANTVFRRLKDRFAFESLTTDMLSHAYENAMVTRALRRQLGIYYTPRPITEYILARLPLESIDPKDIYLCDPCCGSGSFLLAGFDRLTGLLRGSATPAQQHNYIKARLIGTDVDGFACEIAKLSLVLTDPYNRDGWQVRQIDDVLTFDFPKRPTVIVTNPKFQELKAAGKRREFAADVLQKLIIVAKPGALLGIVMPQSILDSRVGGAARRAVLGHCDILEIAMFPGGVFYSHAETAVLLLRKRGDRVSMSPQKVTVRELRAMHLSSFMHASHAGRSHHFTRTYPVDSSAWIEDAHCRFIASPLMGLWKRLEGVFSPLREVAELSAGLQVHKTDSESVSNHKRNNEDKPYIDRLDVLRPFVLFTSHRLRKTKWIRYGPQLRRMAKAEVFRRSKVLINSNRNPGSAWRMVAATAPGDLYFSDNFHAITPREGGVPLEVVAAVLNGPLANAWFDSHSRKRKVILDVLGNLPFPTFDTYTTDTLCRLVRLLERVLVSEWRRLSEGLFYDGPFLDENTVMLLNQIDGLVYEAYSLTSEERQQVDSIMNTENRPT